MPNTTSMSEIYLCYLRKYTNPLCTRHYIDNFYQCLVEEGKTIVETDTCEEELKRLCEKGYHRAALYYTEKVRKRENPLCDSHYIYEIKQTLKMANLNFWERVQLGVIISLLYTNLRGIASRWMAFVMDVPI